VEERTAAWGESPLEEEDVYQVFEKYIAGSPEVNRIPWYVYLLCVCVCVCVCVCAWVGTWYLLNMFIMSMCVCTHDPYHSSFLLPPSSVFLLPQV
jgi:hypothetical protein